MALAGPGWGDSPGVWPVLGPGGLGKAEPPPALPSCRPQFCGGTPGKKGKKEGGAQQQQRVMLLSRSPSGPKKYFPIPVEHLEEEIRLRSADDCKRFREEFNSLPSGHVQGAFETANKEENQEKNRYPNILPNDHSRVILSLVDGVPCSDYINASYIDGYKEKNKFIAAQGPKQETVNDFWRMIWEQKSATIVMLTNLKERKEEKCHQYWPDQGCWTYGNIRVSVEDCIVLVDYTIRKFCIQS
ncbi:receptor-type tyrosine-protein phosphatase epsilon-like, partial [Gracilinanus agilis]|uniref:receptor-type tyrosine-protein phosphatase epsilon-like n=1 Tax=Gracilinanus agilis TaxID=191870 RepID=UPI001CFDB5E3